MKYIQSKIINRLTVFLCSESHTRCRTLAIGIIGIITLAIGIIAETKQISRIKKKCWAVALLLSNEAAR